MALAGAQQHREDEQVVPVDQVRVGQAPRELRAAVDEDGAAVLLPERGDVLVRAQDRRLAPVVDQGVVAERGRDHELGQLLVGGVVLRSGPRPRERLVAAAAEHQRRRLGELLGLEREGLRHEVDFAHPAAAAVPFGRIAG